MNEDRSRIPPEIKSIRKRPCWKCGAVDLELLEVFRDQDIEAPLRRWMVFRCRACDAGTEAIIRDGKLDFVAIGDGA